MSTYEFETGGQDRLVGQLRAHGGATNDVPTQNASGFLVQAPGGGSMPVQVATLTLADADILALPTTPLEIIPAPGAGKVLVPSSAFAWCDTTAGVYTNIDPLAQLGFGWDSGPGGIDGSGGPLAYLSEAEGSDGSVSGLLAFTGVAFCTFGPNGDPNMSNGDSSTLGEQFLGFLNGAASPNQGLVIVAGNQLAGDFTGGDPANRLIVSVTYSVLDVS